jgi:hypothetical protein
MGGGSGSPIFYNDNKRVIGTISGGLDYNCNSALIHDWAGKLRSCNNLKDVLFGNTGLSTVGGIDRNQSCQYNLSLSGDFYSTEYYDNSLNELPIQAENQITITNATFRPGSNYVVSAGNKIVIGQGTKIKSNFTAKISACSNNLLLCGNEVQSSIATKQTTDNTSNIPANLSYQNTITDYSKGKLTEDVPILESSEIYPNPTNGKIYFDFHETPTKIEICGLDGKILITVNSSMIKDGSIDISMLSNGIFIVKAHLKNSVKSFKIVKI